MLRLTAQGMELCTGAMVTGQLERFRLRSLRRVHWLAPGTLFLLHRVLR